MARYLILNTEEDMHEIVDSKDKAAEVVQSWDSYGNFTDVDYIEIYELGKQFKLEKSYKVVPV